MDTDPVIECICGRAAPRRRCRELCRFPASRTRIATEPAADL